MNAETDRALRSLDAAAGTLTVSEQERAATTLERIVATAPSAAIHHPAARTPTRRFRRRLILVPTGALALVVGSVVLKGDSGGGAAYASWTATPSDVSFSDLGAAASACRGKLQRDDTIDSARARLVLAERRGDHVALLYRTEDPDLSAPCLVRNPKGSTDVEDVDFGVGGSTGPALKAPVTGFTQGAVFEHERGRSSITDGAVGEEVTGVTIHASDFTVQASVKNGRYVAWWPGPAFERLSVEPGGRGGPRLNLTYDLTLADGTVVRSAQPARPS